MYYIMSRRFTVLTAFLALLIAIVTIGCTSREPIQRRAFIVFLQTQILDRKQVFPLPELTSENRRALGPYVSDYQIFSDFYSDMRKARQSLRSALKIQNRANNPKNLLENLQELSTQTAELPKIRRTLSDNLQKAQVSRSGLKQPNDLKLIYDRAFDKAITTPADNMRNIILRMEIQFLSLEDIGHFLNDNQTNLTISGVDVKFKDSTLLAQYQSLQNRYNTERQALSKAFQALRAASVTR
jgi:hypothetical protein